MTDERTRDYPLPLPDGEDSRFTFGFLADVMAVIERHGYPPVRDGMDMVELQTALFGFLYAAPLVEEDDAEPGGVAEPTPAESHVARPERPVQPRAAGGEGEDTPLWRKRTAVEHDDALLDHLGGGGEPHPFDPLSRLLSAWRDEVRSPRIGGDGREWVSWVCPECCAELYSPVDRLIPAIEAHMRSDGPGDGPGGAA